MPYNKHSLCLPRSAMILIVAFFILLSSQVHAFDIKVHGLFKDMAIITVDGEQRKLRVGQISPEGIKLISANSEQAVMEVRGKKESYTLGENVSISFAEKEKMEARIWSIQGTYLTNGLINDSHVKFLVDTGATWIAMNRKHAEKIGIEYTLTGDTVVASTANGDTNVHKVLLKKVKVGDIELRNVEAVVMKNSNPKYILLGNSFLDRVQMKREGEVMLLKEK